MSRPFGSVLGSVLIFALLAGTSGCEKREDSSLRAAGDTSARPAIPAIIDVARTTQIVLIGEVHGSMPLHRFFRSLLADGELRAVIDDVVVEFGNSRYQPVMDAYIEGRAVPLARVRRAWELTTQGSVWLAPEYEAFFRSIRESNKRVPPSRRLRVLLGDPPISRAQLRDPHLVDLFRRDPHFATVIQREVVARGRRAVVIAGAGHVVRAPSQYPTLSNLLERRALCETDPAAAREGIDWCDDAKSFAAVSTHVILPESVIERTDLIDDLRQHSVATLAAIAETELRGVPSQTSGDDGSAEQAWTLDKAADSVLVLPSKFR